jgi:hypothetical protein
MRFRIGLAVFVIGCVAPDVGMERQSLECQCTGGVDNFGNAVSAQCGGSVCGADLHVYACEDGVWVYQSQGCDGSGGCLCTGGTDSTGQSVSAACGESVCGADFQEYDCVSGQWRANGTTCGSPPTCECTNGTDVEGNAVSTACGQSVCGSDSHVYDCIDRRWQWTEAVCDATSAIGCSDGEAESANAVPGVVACAGDWNGAIHLRAASSGRACGDDGELCERPADLCSPGWHVCAADGEVADLRDRVTPEQCEALAAGQYVAASSHTSSTTSGVCTPAGETTTCNASGTWGAEPLCCGSDCNYGICDDDMWIDATPLGGGFLEGCAEMTSQQTNGVLCCSDQLPDPPPECVDRVLNGEAIDTACPGISVAQRRALEELVLAMQTMVEEYRAAMVREAQARARTRSDGVIEVALCFGLLAGIAFDGVGATPDPALTSDCAWVTPTQFASVAHNLYFADMEAFLWSWVDLYDPSLGLTPSEYYWTRSSTEQAEILARVDSTYTSNKRHHIEYVLSLDTQLSPLAAKGVLEVVYYQYADPGFVSSAMTRVWQCDVEHDCCGGDVLCTIVDRILLDLRISIMAGIMFVDATWSAITGHGKLSFQEWIAAGLLTLAPSLGWANASCSAGPSVQCALDVIGATLELTPFLKGIILRGGRALAASRAARASMPSTGRLLGALPEDLVDGAEEYLEISDINPTGSRTNCHACTPAFREYRMTGVIREVDDLAPLFREKTLHVSRTRLESILRAHPEETVEIVFARGTLHSMAGYYDEALGQFILVDAQRAIRWIGWPDFLTEWWVACKGQAFFNFIGPSLD